MYGFAVHPVCEDHRGPHQHRKLPVTGR